MHIILSYDVNKKRCGKVMKICRKFLWHIQNSVFDGEISEKNYKLLIFQLNEVLLPNEGDSLLIYELRTTKYTSKKVFGGKFSKRENII